MNSRYFMIAFLVGLNTIAPLGNSLSAQEPTITGNESMITPESSSSECLPNADLVSQRIQLFYYRQATNIVSILRAIPSLKCLAIANYSEDSIILSGQQDLIEKAYQVIASIDLPLPGIDMQMWGVQISSDDPGDLAQVMTQIREEINLTQQLLQDTLAVLKQYLRNIPQEESLSIAVDLEFQSLINSLGYESFLNLNRPLSLIDIVLSGDALASAEDSLQFNQALYSNLIEFMNQDPRYAKYLAAMKEKGRPPFDRFFRSRGLQPKCTKYEDLKNQQKCEVWNWVEISPGSTENYVKINRKVLLEFALQYGNFVANPSQFSPYKLQQTANALNDRLQDTTNALNKDIEDLFVGPTLDNIQGIVSRFGAVDYAQVGRTAIASLNGIETTVRSNSVSAFDVTPPLKLSELLTNAENLSQLNETERFQFDPVTGIDGFCYLEEQVELYIANQFGDPYQKNWQDRRCSTN